MITPSDIVDKFIYQRYLNINHSFDKFIYVFIKYKIIYYY